MTALAGLWRLDGNPDAADTCDRMLAAQRIYGPDDGARWAEGPVALGRRLARLLPEDSYDGQPLHSPDGRAVLVADVRLDNRDELCAALNLPAERARRSSDADILLAAYGRWVEECCDRLVGDFAFALWDKLARRLVLARDPLGARPLHYHCGARLFAFASMPKGLHALAEIPHQPDEDYLAWEMIAPGSLGTRTCFKDITRVEPGHIAIVTRDGVSARRYWNPGRKILALHSPDAYAEACREQLDIAVRCRLRGADHVATHLSAGFDSSAVTATAARLSADPGKNHRQPGRQRGPLVANGPRRGGARAFLRRRGNRSRARRRRRAVLPMTGSSVPALPRMYLRQPGSLLAATLFCAVAAGVFAQNVVAYLFIALPATLPLLLWLRAGALAIPILPVISALFFVYYAIPLLRGQSTAYSSDELIQAGTAVAAFLVAASMASWPFQRSSGGRFSLFNQSQFADPQLAPIVFVGLCAGIVFHLAVVADSLAWLGSSFGLLRSVVLTLASISCYLLGHTRASGLLVGPAWAFAFGGLLLLILLALSNLFLVGGLMYCLAAFLGYVITAKRIPWLGLGTAFAMLAVLHAGKFELRDTYWAHGASEGREISVGQIPSVMVDWFGAGIDALWSGGAQSDVLERASLLHMLVLVQRTTPDFIPYLEGETYALLPSMLVPRFVDPEKTVSQAALNLLSIRYGLQTLESVARTTIGWGLVSEAYANFGYWAVIAVGALFGAICGALMRLSVGAPPNSLPMFITIAATLVLLNVEADFAYLLTTLVQTLAAILIVAALAYLLRGRRRAIVPVAAAASARVHHSIGDASLP